METDGYGIFKSEITLILGEQEAEKYLAEKLAMDTDAFVTYLAAADAQDSEMERAHSDPQKKKAGRVEYIRRRSLRDMSGDEKIRGCFALTASHSGLDTPLP